MTTQEICTEPGLSTANVHVILHRARLAPEHMKLCLDFGTSRGCTKFEWQLPRLGEAAKAYATNTEHKDV